MQKKSFNFVFTLVWAVCVYIGSVTVLRATARVLRRKNRK